MRAAQPIPSARDARAGPGRRRGGSRADPERKAAAREERAGELVLLHVRRVDWNAPRQRVRLHKNRKAKAPQTHSKLLVRRH